MKNNNLNNIDFNNNNASRDHKLENQKRAKTGEFEGRIDLNRDNLSQIKILNKYNKNKIKIKIGDINYSADSTTLDITTNGINGLVDGIVIENSHKYLIWAFANAEHTAFEGFGLTRWSKVVFTAVASGTKGLEATYTTAGTTINNCYQFTVGARVRVYNSTEWNYGIVTGIDSATSVRILMDNCTGYGNNITSVTSAEIRQFDHAPVTSNGTLFRDNYTLVGWCELGVQEAGTGAIDLRQSIVTATIWSEKRFFKLPAILLINTTTALATNITGAPANISIGGFVSPYTSEMQGLVLIICSSGCNTVMAMNDPLDYTLIGQAQMLNNFGAASQYDNAFLTTRISHYYNINVSRIDATTNSKTFRLYLIGYWEED